jgi:hypothetical protein
MDKIIKLPIPIFEDESILCQEVEIKEPTASIIADTRKMYEASDDFGAVLFFVSSCIVSMKLENDTEETDYNRIKSLCRKMPYRTAEYLSIKILLLSHDDDAVEGTYPCPRCGGVCICEIKKDKSTGEVIYDTRDFIHQLEVKYLDEYSEIEIELEYPIELTSTRGQHTEVIESVKEFSFRHPTLEDAIKGSKRVADKKDSIRQQFGIYVEAITKVDGEIADNKWKNNYGMLIFNKMNFYKDFKSISQKVSEYGINKRVLRTCENCGKEWYAILNTSNFFDLEARFM